MKRFLAAVLAAAVCFGAAACGTNPKKEDAAMTEPTTAAAARLISGTENQFTAADGVFSLHQPGQDNPPIVEFTCGDALLQGGSWVLQGNLAMNGMNNTATLRVVADESNFCEFFILRKLGGLNCVRRSITRNGVRLQDNLNEIVIDNLQDGAQWSAAFTLIFCDGYVYLFLQEPGEARFLVTSYGVDWETCKPVLEATKDTVVTLTDLLAEQDAENVSSIYRHVGVTGEVKGSAKVLFLGNSGIFYYDAPNTFSRLARQAGYLVEVNTVARSSALLLHHATDTDYLNKLTKKELAKGYDLVLLQENTSCIKDDATKNRTRLAVRALNQLIQESGAKTVLYVRAPRNDYGTASDPVTASRQLDELFTPLGEELGADSFYINRAFAEAYRTTEINLWAADNAHPNSKGSYLAACVVFASVFQTSCQVLPDDGLPAEEALALRQIADRVVLENYIPW